jgi:hypothetical protein
MPGHQRNLLVGILFTKGFYIPLCDQLLNMSGGNEGVISNPKTVFHQFQSMANLFGLLAQCVQSADHNDLFRIVRNDRLRIVRIFQGHMLGTVSLYQNHLCMSTSRSIGFF